MDLISTTEPLFRPQLHWGFPPPGAAAKVQLGWQSSTGATSYNVKRATTSGGPYTTVASGLATLDNTDSGLTNGNTYYYVVTAANARGESANSIENSATPYTAPGTPTQIQALSGDRQITLSWTSVNEATSYNIQRSTSSGGPYTMVGSSASAGYTDFGLANGAAYYYVISARNLGGDSANSTEASAIPLLPAPTSLGATPGNAAVNLTWNAVSSATGYQLSRSTTGGAPYSVIASPASNNYLDSGLTSGTTYTYVVAAVRNTEQSANSAPVSVTPSANFANWQQQYFTSGQLSDPSISGRNGDANQDGTPNLIAYAFNASPWVNITPYLPTISTDGGILTITFTRRKAPTDISYTVEVAGDLATWNSGPSYTTETSATSLGPDTERVTVRDNTSDSTRRFIRVEITP